MGQIDDFLMGQERETLAYVLSELLVRHPELQPEADALCAAARAFFSGPPTTQPVDLAEVQTSLRTAFQAARSRYSGGLDGSALAGAIIPWFERAGEHLEAGASGTVLELLAVIVDELAEAGDAVYDQSGDLYECVLAIGNGFARALLLASLTDAERKAWEYRIEAWSGNLQSFLDPEALRAAQVVARHGWDYPPLNEILRGETTGIPPHPHPAGEVLRVLGPVVLTVLQQQGRWDEFAALSAALSGIEL